jgi:broad specificity phosphatase PhoE
MADEELERITILLQARDRDFARAMDRNNKLIARLQRDAGRNTSKMARDIDSNLSKAAASVGALGKAFVAGAAATAVGVLTSNLTQGVRAVAQIGDEARRSGLGVEAFQALGYVATQSRIPIDALVDGMKELNLRADEFIVTGKGPAAEAFARIGLGAADLERKLEAPEELLLEIIGRMKDLDRAAQIRVADEIFGGTGGERFVELLARGEDGMRAMMQEAREMGLVMEAELVAKAQRIDAEFSRLIERSSTWAKGLAVALADLPFDVVETRLREIFPDEGEGRAILGDEIYDRLAEVTDLADEQVEGLRRLAAEYGRLGEEADRLRPSLDQAVLSLMALGERDAAAAIMAARDRMGELNEGLQDGTVGAEDFRAGMVEATGQAEAALAGLEEIDRATFSGVISQVGALARSLAEAAARAAEVRRSLPGGTLETTPMPGEPVAAELPPGRYAPTSSQRPQMPDVDFSFGVPDGPKGGGAPGGGGSEKQSDWERELERTREEIARLEAESASLLVVAEYGTELGDAMEYARKRAELLYAAQQSGLEITPELTAQIDEQAMAWMRASLEADAHADRLEQLQDRAERGADAMTDLFMSIFDGSMSAKDAVLQLIAEILRAQAMEGFRTLAAAGGGVTGWLGGLLANARGNAFSTGSVVPFAKGGVFDSPTYFPMVGGRTGVLGEGLDDEAILPLRRGSDGKLGVRAQGSGKGRNITLNPVFQVDARGAQRGAAEEFAMQLRRAYPQLMQDAVKAVRKESLETRFS